MAYPLLSFWKLEEEYMLYKGISTLRWRGSHCHAWTERIKEK